MAVKMDPIHQFELKPIFSLGHIGHTEIVFTNAALYMLAAVAIITLLTVFATRRNSVIPSRMQSLAEVLYEFLASTVRSSAGEEGMRFFPFVFSLFMFVLVGNLLGMLPYAFTFTSHIAMTLALATVVFILVTVVALAIHGTHFFSYFIPEGAPKLLAPLIIPIEVIFYLSRPVSLSVRLFANMVAGHVLLKVFATFVVLLGTLGAVGPFVAVLPLSVNVLLVGFELLVAFLQAYVFAILTCIYLHDAVHLH